VERILIHLMMTINTGVTAHTVAEREITMDDNEVVKIAQQIAYQAHKGQQRRGGQDYIEHPKRVSQRVGKDKKAQAVAWLHDVLEDAPVSVFQLAERGIPNDVILAVECITRNEFGTYEDYLKGVRENHLACKVKINDICDNLGDKPTMKQIRTYGKALVYLTEEKPTEGT
jgi:(p)ppGpp synthase/HD superfamily hydrolase